jgi:H+/Cl- antiporter ClcA
MATREHESAFASNEPVLPMPFLVLTLIVGLGAGTVSSAYLFVLHTMQHHLSPARFSSAAEFAVLGLAGVAVILFVRVLGSPGDVELLVDNIHVSGGAPSVRSLRSLVPMSLVTISVGGAAGPEAPLVTTCGTLAGWFSRVRRLSVTESRCLTIAGMAAAFAVLFGAPVGAGFFALEILHRRGLEYHEALAPALIGALAGYACSLVLTITGGAPVWSIPGVSALRVSDLAWAIGAGVVGAVIAIVFTYVVAVLRRVAGYVPRSVRAALGGLVLATLALWSPYALTYGEAQTSYVLTHHLAAGALVVAAIAKLLGTSTTMASSWPGGFIIPLFFIGATLGELTQHAFPSVHVGVVVAALMVATNVGVTKTFVGSTLVVSEMGGLRLLPPTLVAALVALLLTSSVRLIATQRERSPIEDSQADADSDGGP